MNSDIPQSYSSESKMSNNLPERSARPSSIISQARVAPICISNPSSSRLGIFGPRRRMTAELLSDYCDKNIGSSEDLSTDYGEYGFKFPKDIKVPSGPEDPLATCPGDCPVCTYEKNREARQKFGPPLPNQCKRMSHYSSSRHTKPLILPPSRVPFHNDGTLGLSQRHTKKPRYLAYTNYSDGLQNYTPMSDPFQTDAGFLGILNNLNPKRDGAHRDVPFPVFRQPLPFTADSHPTPKIPYNSKGEHTPNIDDCEFDRIHGALQQTLEFHNRSDKSLERARNQQGQGLFPAPKPFKSHIRSSKSFLPR